VAWPMNRLLLLASGGTPGGGGEEEGAYREDSLKVAKCTFGTDIRKFGRLGFVDARESIDARSSPSSGDYVLQKSFSKDLG